MRVYAKAVNSRQQTADSKQQQQTDLGDIKAFSNR
jgi:hypothetical protein